MSNLEIPKFYIPTPLSPAEFSTMNVVKTVLDRGRHVQSKVCVTCNRPFTWRKKWERCWDEVTTCSKRCNTERRRANRRVAKGFGQQDDDDDERVKPPNTLVDLDHPLTRKEQKQADKTERKRLKKQLQRKKRALRTGMQDASVGRKPCDTCSKLCDVLIRCRIDASRDWKMICGGACWKKYSGGVPDGTPHHPFYTYGGLWKNLKKL
jgi:hypothetical protein